MRCPRCGSELDVATLDPGGMVTCRCGLRAYAGYLTELSALDARRAWLAERVQAGDPAPPPDLAARWGVWPAPTSGAPPGSPIAPGAPAGPVVARPAPSAQTLLLGVGALLLVVAGAVFAAVVWQRLGALGQVALMLGATLGIGGLAVWLRSRLAGTAEALAVVAAGLAIVDLLAAPALGLLPERWLSDPTLYPALALLVLGIALLALHARFHLRAWSWLGWLLLPIGAGLVAPAVASAVDSDAWAAAAVALPALLSVTVLAARDTDPRLHDQRPPMLLAGWAGLVVSGLATASAATVRDALPGALLTTVLTAGALGLWARVEPAAAPGTTARALRGWDLPTLLPLATAALVGASVGMALAVPPDPQPVWLAAIVALGGLGVGLAALAVSSEAAPAVVGSAAAWASWAWLRMNAMPVPDASANVQDQLSLLAALVALAAFVVAWWLPWTGWVGALLGELALALSPWAPADVVVVEAYALPFAALLLLAGLLWHRLRPGPSLHWLGPAVAIALIPSAAATWLAPWAWGDPDAATGSHFVRLGVVLVAGVACAAVGARLHLGGLLLPGAVALVIAALAQLASGLSNLPRWLGLGIAGVLLIAAGARVEALRREGHRAAAWVGTLR